MGYDFKNFSKDFTWKKKKKPTQTYPEVKEISILYLALNNLKKQIKLLFTIFF